MDGQGNSEQQESVGPLQGVSFRVEIASLGVSFPCRSGQSLLGAMIASGERPLAVGCRNGGCGVCRVRVLSGHFTAGRMSRAAVTPIDEQAGIMLSCQTYPASDICVEPLPLTPARSCERMGIAA